MREYELMLLLDPEMDDAARTAIIERIQETVAKDKGTWVKTDEWGRRKTAYEIAKKPDAHYYVMQFDAEPATLDEITRVLRITDGVMRIMATMRIPPQPEAKATAAANNEERGRGRGRDRGDRSERGGGRGRDRG